MIVNNIPTAAQQYEHTRIKEFGLDNNREARNKTFAEPEDSAEDILNSCGVLQ